MVAKGFTLVDTSAWLAVSNALDPNHEAAAAFLEELPRLITTNFIIDETITLVLKRVGYRAARTLGDALWTGAHAVVLFVSREDHVAAWDLFKKYDDQAFSFTDCTSFAIMRRVGLAQVFSFDSDFDRTGDFTRVPR